MMKNSVNDEERVKWHSDQITNLASEKQEFDWCCCDSFVFFNESLGNACVPLSEPQQVCPSSGPIAALRATSTEVKSVFFLLKGDRTLFVEHVMSFNLVAEVFQHVVQNGTGLVRLISQRTTVFLGPWPHLFQMRMRRWQDSTDSLFL